MEDGVIPKQLLYKFKIHIHGKEYRFYISKVYILYNQWNSLSRDIVPMEKLELKAATKGKPLLGITHIYVKDFIEYVSDATMLSLTGYPYQIKYADFPKIQEAFKEIKLKIVLGII